MASTINVDRYHLHYSDGPHKLKLSAEWSFVAKTEDCPGDFEIVARDLRTWPEPAAEPIEPAGREALLDGDYGALRRVVEPQTRWLLVSRISSERLKDPPLFNSFHSIRPQ